VFSTDYNREGIKKGTAVALLVKNGGNSDAETKEPAEVRYREWWGTKKRTDLLSSLNDSHRDAHYESVQSVIANRYSLKPRDVSGNYLTWPKLIDLCAQPPINGLMEKRGGALIDIDRNALAKRIQAYFDSTQSDATVRQLHPGLMRDAARFDAAKARKKLLSHEIYDDSRLQRYAVRAFDTRHCYYTPIRPLWNEPRPPLWAQHEPGNRYLIVRPASASDPEGMPLMFTRCLGDNDFLRGHAYYIPFVWHPETVEISAGATQSALFSTATIAVEPTANLSIAARTYLASLGLQNSDNDTVELLWMHALAIGYSPAYLSDHADGIEDDWPAIPLPATQSALLTSAALGRQIAALLDTETPVSGVTSGAIRNELQTIAVVSRKGDGPLQSEEFKVTADWGSKDKAGVTMPGRGKSETRAATDGELSPALAHALRAKSKQADANEHAENQTLVSANHPCTSDIFLNDTAYWKNIPLPVWDFTIGGYQVMKKWLSYREYELLGRPLHMEELDEVTAMARRLTALVLLQPTLDDNYRAIAADTTVWPPST
jgi:hypothetical protein